MNDQGKEKVLIVDYDQPTALRLDKILVQSLPEYSRSRLQGLIEDGQVTIDGMLATKASQILTGPCRVEVRVPPPIPTETIPENIPLDIIFENEELLIVNKPAGMVVHPAVGHPSGTLVNAALAHDPEMEGIGGEIRPGLVHRLDKDTSGLILLAKTDAAQRYMQDQFRLRKIEKYYLALVDGKLPTPTGRIEAAVGRDLHDRKRMAVVPLQKGREAVSEYRILELFRDHTLVEVHPITGRTHQIRLHMAFLGCPVTGDRIYGRKTSSIPMQRHFLHAARLLVRFPGEKQLRTFEAPLPPDLNEVLVYLRNISR